MYNENKYLGFMDAYVDEQYIYAAGYEQGALFRIHRGTDEVELLGKLDKYQNGISHVIRSVFRKDDRLFLFSYFSYEVAVYDLRDGGFHYYYPPERNIVFDSVRLIHRQGDKVWIFREFSEPSVVCFSMENCSYEFFSLNTSLLLEHCEGRTAVSVFVENDCYFDEKIWRVIPGTNVVYSIELPELNIEIYEVPCAENFYVVSEYGGIFYLSTLDGKNIVVWNPAQGVLSRIQIPADLSKERGYREWISNENRGIMVPAMADCLIYGYFTDSHKVAVSVMSLPDKLSKIHDAPNRAWFINYYCENTQVLLFPFGSNAALEICLETMELTTHQYIIPAQDYLKIVCEADGIIQEGTVCQLEDYIDILKEI